MASARDNSAPFQRNALAPGLLAAAVLFASPLLIAWIGTAFLFIVAILALIVAWFAFQARQWWWTIVFVAIAVVWNPIVTFAFSGPWWYAANIVAAIAFITAGALIKNERVEPQG